MIPTIEAANMWQTTDLDELIAVELFGWQWWSWVGTPTRSHPDYPKQCRVRQLLSTQNLGNQRWQDFLTSDDKAASRATGDEPLSYAYCSSMGPAMVPHFSGHLDDAAVMEKELRKRGLLKKYGAALIEVCGSPKKAILASAKKRCIAALLSIDSPSIRAIHS